MHRTLLASTAALAIATSAHAADVTTKSTDPLKTSTVNGGAPDTITITSAGSVVVGSGTAVTMDDNHSVTNAGAITISNANGATGIAAVAGTTGDIVNTGTITVDEPYTPTDTDNDGDLDGPFALGSGRYGIHVLGDHTGKVSNSGTISVEGNDSAGIALDGKLTGSFTHDGKTTLLGDRTVGVQAHDISGNVRLAGTVSAMGKDAVGARFSGNVDGAMVVQGTISSTGYRYVTPPSDTSKLDADDLLQGGSALVIEGNVGGGIILAIPPKDSDPKNTDEDGDGIDDSKEGSANVVALGAAPAMIVGATDHAVAIGAIAGTADHYGLQIDGTVKGMGIYAGVNATGLQIGGRGGDVTIANGIGIAGAVSAQSNGASATAVRIGSGATTPEIRVSGTVSAGGGNAATAFTTGIALDAGANVATIRNSGTIKAVAGGDSGNATAILDGSGHLALVENSGTISASGAKSDSTRNVAIDLSANASGATVKQTQVGAGFNAPAIAGDVRFGSGADTLSLADGTMKGNAYFGAGANTFTLSGDAVHTGSATFGAGNDTMTLAGTSQFLGAADFGGGADTLSLSGTALFKGTLANASSLAVNVAGGTLDIAKPTAIGSLAVGADGVLVATLDKTAGNGTAYTVAGTASFASGSRLSLRLANVHDAVGSYTVIHAGTLQGAAGLKIDDAMIPFLFKASVAGNAPAGDLNIDVAKRSAQELGLNRSQAGAYDAIFAALGKDDQIGGVFLGITQGDAFRGKVRQMLPDHAGGSFEGISQGIRAFSRQTMDAESPVYSFGSFDVVLGAAGWTLDKDEGQTAAYNLGGFGFSGGVELHTGVGSFGLGGNWLWNSYNQGSSDNVVKSDTYALDAYWRGTWGGLSAFARASAGKVDFHGRRTFTGMNGSQAIERNAIADRGGNVVAASGGLSYEGGSAHLFFRPTVSLDYIRLKENGYSDTGGGAGLDLTVDARTSDELAVNGGLALGIDFTGMRKRDENWFRVEAEGGWREIAGGTLGATTAHFGSGADFTLLPDQDESGWYARVRALGGSRNFKMTGEAGAERRFGGTALSLRGSLTLGF